MEGLIYVWHFESVEDPVSSLIKFTFLLCPLFPCTSVDYRSSFFFGSDTLTMVAFHCQQKRTKGQTIARTDRTNEREEEKARGRIGDTDDTDNADRVENG